MIGVCRSDVCVRVVWGLADVYHIREGCVCVCSKEKLLTENELSGENL